MPADCPSENKSVTPRAALVARDGDGEPLGAAVFLDSDDLRALGLNLDSVDHVTYVVEEGDLCVAEGDQ